MKKVRFFSKAIIVLFVSILSVTSCKKDDDSSSGSGLVISGIVMDDFHNPVRNGEVHFMMPKGNASSVGFCEPQQAVFKTDDKGYVKANFQDYCPVVNEVEMVVFNEEGAKIRDVYAKLFLFHLSQSFLDVAGFNSDNGLFFPDNLSYINNSVEMEIDNTSDFDIKDTIYLLLPPNAWEDKSWHLEKFPISNDNEKRDFSFRWTFSLDYFHQYHTSYYPKYFYVTDNADLANYEELENLPPVTAPSNLALFSDVISRFIEIEVPHQNVGGENHIKLTVKKENGSIVVVKED